MLTDKFVIVLATCCLVTVSSDVVNDGKQPTTSPRIPEVTSITEPDAEEARPADDARLADEARQPDAGRHADDAKPDDRAADTERSDKSLEVMSNGQQSGDDGLADSENGETQIRMATPLRCFNCEFLAEIPVYTCLDPIRTREQMVTCDLYQKCYIQSKWNKAHLVGLSRGCRDNCTNGPTVSCCEANMCNAHAYMQIGRMGPDLDQMFMTRPDPKPRASSARRDAPWLAPSIITGSLALCKPRFL